MPKKSGRAHAPPQEWHQDEVDEVDDMEIGSEDVDDSDVEEDEVEVEGPGYAQFVDEDELDDDQESDESEAEPESDDESESEVCFFALTQTQLRKGTPPHSHRNRSSAVCQAPQGPPRDAREARRPKCCGRRYPTCPPRSSQAAAAQYGRPQACALERRRVEAPCGARSTRAQERADRHVITPPRIACAPGRRSDPARKAARSPLRLAVSGPCEPRLAEQVVQVPARAVRK